MKISVCLLCYKCEPYINFINHLFDNIIKIYNKIEFEFFLYENDSNDKTNNAIRHFFRNKKGKYIFEKNIRPENLDTNSLNLDRGIYMAKLRNTLKKYHGILNSNYTLLLDVDVVFNMGTILKLIKTLQTNEDCAMVSGFVISGLQYYRRKCLHYFDNAAFISDLGIAYNHTGNTCQFKGCAQCAEWRIDKDNWLIRGAPHPPNGLPDYSYLNNLLHDNNKLIKVQSAFGSLSIIRTSVYNKISWGTSICEHLSFCKVVSNFGIILLNSEIKYFIREHERQEDKKDGLYGFQPTYDKMLDELEKNF